MHTDSSQTICECGNPIVKPRRLFCSDKCNKKARQKRWRDKHPEYRYIEERRVYVGPDLEAKLRDWGGQRGMTHGAAARHIIAGFFGDGERA